MQKFLNILIWILGGIVFLVLVASLVCTFASILNTSNDLTISQRLSLLPTVAISAGVLIAIVTFLRERKKQEVERQRHMSEVFLAQVKEGFDTVIKLLSDLNNNRVTWIRAARTLLKSVALKDKILAEEYKVAYELAEERTRNELYSMLSLTDQKSGERLPLPAQFFYGIDDWRECKTLDEAAIKASSDAKAYSVTLDEVPPLAHSKPLSEKSVIAIFDFVEYPKTYDDPLKAVGDWDDNWDTSFGIDQGARRYIAHNKQKIAIGGKLHDRESKKNS